MSELKRVGDELRHLRYETRTVLKAIDWRLSREARITREELLMLQGLIHIDADVPPKVLQISTEDAEYVSIRRQEGQRLYRNDDTGDSYTSRSIFEADADLLQDGYIGLLVVPHGANCKNEDLIRRCEEEEVHGWELEHLLYQGVKFEPKDWELKFARIRLVKRVGNNFYTLGEFPDHFDRRNTISQIKPDNSGKLQLLDETYYISDQEMTVRREWYDSRARFYVLVKGSSEKQALGKSDVTEKKVEPQTQII